MPQAVIVIFLLFFAVLAFAWFYFQRAKGRTSTPSASTTAPTTTPVETAAAEHTDHAEHADHAH